MAWYGLHTGPLSGRAGRPLVSAAWYGIHILAIYQSISGSARPYINPSCWPARPAQLHQYSPIYCSTQSTPSTMILVWKHQHQGRGERTYKGFWKFSLGLLFSSLVPLASNTSVTHVKAFSKTSLFKVEVGEGCGCKMWQHLTHTYDLADRILWWVRGGGNDL